jgi:ATP-dependent RNA helicase DOB1
VPITGEVDFTVSVKKIAPVWGVIINFEKIQTAVKETFDEESKGPSETKFKVDILANCKTVENEGRTKLVQPLSLDETGEPAVVSVPLSQVC